MIFIQFLSSRNPQEKTINSQILPALEKLAETFKNPGLVMKKRDRKRIDHDRLKELKERGQPADEALEKSAKEYLALHAQLLEELPKFLLLCCKYLDAIAAALAKVQVTCINELRSAGGAWQGWDGIKEAWKAAFAEVGLEFDSLSTAETWRTKTFGPPPGGAKRPTVRPESRAASFASVTTANSIPSLVQQPAGDRDRASSGYTVAATPSAPFEAACVFPYHGVEISLAAGEVVRVEFVDEEGGWMWAATSDGREGWVESHHLERMG